jgi:uncharacterized membrane protein
MSVAVLVAIGLQLAVPSSMALHPRWLIPVLDGAILVALLIVNPGRMLRRSVVVRVITLALVGAISVGNAGSLVLLIKALLTGHAGQRAAPLLLSGAAIWLTNVIAFSIWYWEFDRGGPATRAAGLRPHPDLMFPQQANPDMANPDWEPQFFDYLYTSFTNASAFSPTDTMPLSRWTKLAFLIQSAISLVTVALVVARVANILR